MIKMDRERYIGNPNLKKFTRGTLATNKQPTKQEIQIFLLFVKGKTLKLILDALKNSGIIYSEQQMFDIIRKVGLYYQTFYKESVSIPFDIPKVIFSHFVKGDSIQQLIDDNHSTSQEIGEILRKIGLLYASYKVMDLK